MRHELTAMRWVDKVASRYRASIRGKPSMRTCWMLVFECPLCHATKHVPANLYRNPYFTCQARDASTGGKTEMKKLAEGHTRSMVEAVEIVDELGEYYANAPADSDDRLLLLKLARLAKLLKPANRPRERIG